MVRFLVLATLLTVTLAWDPSLKIAEKIAIPHHIRHGYDYPYIDIAQMMNRRGIAVRPALGSQQPAPFGIAPQQNLGFRQPAAALPPPNRGFQSQPFIQSQPFVQSQPYDQSRGFSNPPRDTRFFTLGVPRPFGYERRSS